jgi:hypothetical protein
MSLISWFVRRAVPRTALILAIPLGSRLVLPPDAQAQHAAGRVRGSVSDSLRQQLAGARVQILELAILTPTDRDGRFELPPVLPGDYHLVVAYIGFRPDTEPVVVRPGQATAVGIVLTPLARVLPSITVSSGRSRGDAMALNQQRTSDQIVNVVPAEVITSLPNTNVADAVGRLPGVTLERDEGEGKYIQVRGTEPRLSNVTINGLHVPSPEGSVRNVKLDVIPAEILGQIELNKTLTPDMEADAIGGSVNLVTRTPGARPFVSLDGLAGYTDLQHGRP